MVLEDRTLPFQENASYVVYDGDCPFCSAYVELVRLREALGKVVLVNAQEGGPIVECLAGRGLALDQEMAFITHKTIYSGSDCIQQLALLSTPSGLFNRLNAMVFSSPRVARLAYPALRAGRNLVLRLLRRGPIRPMPR